MDRSQFFERARRRQLQYASAKHLRILACPLCGADAELTIVSDSWMVECKALDDCGACGPIRSSPDRAAIAWNRRIDTNVADKQVVTDVLQEVYQELRAGAQFENITLAIAARCALRWRGVQPDTPHEPEIGALARGFCRTCGDPIEYIGGGRWQHTTPGHNHEGHER